MANVRTANDKFAIFSELNKKVKELRKAGGLLGFVSTGDKQGQIDEKGLSDIFAIVNEDLEAIKAKIERALKLAGVLSEFSLNTLQTAERGKVIQSFHKILSVKDRDSFAEVFLKESEAGKFLFYLVYIIILEQVERVQRFLDFIEAQNIQLLEFRDNAKTITAKQNRAKRKTTTDPNKAAVTARAAEIWQARPNLSLDDVAEKIRNEPTSNGEPLTDKSHSTIKKWIAPLNPKAKPKP